MERFVRNEGGAIRSLLAQRGASGKLEHFRHYREDLGPAIRRTREMTAYTDHSARNVEFRYEGSIPRIVLHDWLTKKGKTWRDYATDPDLKKDFLAWFRGSRDMTEFKADSYRERPLFINRATAPKLGKVILDNYRKEQGYAKG